MFAITGSGTTMKRPILGAPLDSLSLGQPCNQSSPIPSGCPTGSLSSRTSLGRFSDYNGDWTAVPVTNVIIEPAQSTVEHSD